MNYEKMVIKLCFIWLKPNFAKTCKDIQKKSFGVWR